MRIEFKSKHLSPFGLTIILSMKFSSCMPVGTISGVGQITDVESEIATFKPNDLYA
jgi:hypothetical protein